jgi:phthalate 3,4-dioxygenase ferredoxin reductase subunit
VHLLRTRDDALALRADLRRGGPLVIIGAGFIGAEVAATARGLGVDPITVVDPVPVPLSRVLNPAVAELFTGLHADRGVRTRFGVGVEGIDTGTELAVRLADGTRLPARIVLVGIGAVPNDRWLRGSGLTVDDGLVCDEYCRAVGAPFVLAVGDVARWRHPRHGRLVRAEHWTNAVDQAACVAHTIIHPDDPLAYDPVEYVWSDQYDWRIQLVGRTGGELCHELVPGADPDRAFAVLYADPDGSFAGAVTVNWPRALIACRRALAARVATPTALVREQVLAKAGPRAA